VAGFSIWQPLAEIRSRAKLEQGGGRWFPAPPERQRRRGIPVASTRQIFNVQYSTFNIRHSSFDRISNIGCRMTNKEVTFWTASKSRRSSHPPLFHSSVCFTRPIRSPGRG
jgi:hypothetical protein